MTWDMKLRWKPYIDELALPMKPATTESENGMFEIWAIEADGKRVLVRDDVSEGRLARALVNEGNNGTAIRGEPHRYVAVPDPDAVDAE
jgi:hypothetical protein